MKALTFCILLMIIPFQAFSQEMVKINVPALADKFPPPPADVKAAYLRLECIEVNMAQQCSADKFYQPMTDTLAAIKLQLEKLSLALTVPASSGMQNMTEEEIQTKLDSMSLEEQMQFAMQMSYGAGAMQPESSDEVIAALEEYSQLTEQISMEIQNPGELIQKGITLAQQRDNKHQEINSWFNEEYGKLPIVSFGEVGRGAEPKAEYALKVAALEKHIAAENEYLHALQKFWPEYRGHLQARYMPFQEKLAAINYGEDALNPQNKRLLVSGQGLLLTPAEELLSFSREATENAAKWWLQKLQLGQEKPQD
jgi:hypothetical protein